jgi:hypothetical protein
MKTLDGQVRKVPSYEDTAPDFSYRDLPLNEPLVRAWQCHALTEYE